MDSNDEVDSEEDKPQKSKKTALQMDIVRAGDDIDEVCIYTSISQRCSYEQVFRYIARERLFSRKILKEYDLQNMGVRQLETQRGLVKSLNLSVHVMSLRREVGEAAGISDIRKIDDERHLITLNGPYDALLGFAGTLLQVFRRARSTLSTSEAVGICYDMLRSLTLAIVDHKRLNGVYSKKYVNAMQLLVATIAKPDYMFEAITAWNPVEKLHQRGKRIRVEPVMTQYKANCENAAAEAINTASSTSAINGASEYTVGKVCYAYNAFIGGAGHVHACQSEDKAHISKFHICAMCGCKHAVYNCGALRAFMRLCPFDMTRAHVAQRDFRLPQPYKRPYYPKPDRGAGKGGGGRGHRGGGRGGGGRGRGTPKEENA